MLWHSRLVGVPTGALSAQPNGRIAFTAPIAAQAKNEVFYIILVANLIETANVYAETESKILEYMGARSGN